MLNQTKIFDTEEVRFKEKYGIFINEFRTDKGLAGILYFVFYTFRRLAFIISQILLANHHNVQVSLNCVMSLACLVYIFKYFPVIDKINLISNILSELTVLICFSSILILVNIESIAVERYIEKLFSYTVLSFLCINSITILYNLIVFIRNFWFSHEKERAITFAEKFESHSN